MIAPKLKVTRVERYTDACPTQFYGEFEDGDGLYVRYRGGGLSIEKGVEIDEDADGLRLGERGEFIYLEDVGGPLDGTLSDEDLIALTGHIIEWPPEFVDGAAERDADRARRDVAAWQRLSDDHDEWSALPDPRPGFFSWRIERDRAARDE